MMKSIFPNGSPLYAASLDEKEVPRKPGLYEIHIGEPKDLPSPFRNVLSERNQTLLYIGKAEGEDGIRQRLFRQDLMNIGHATFFRSLGVVLAYMNNVKPLVKPLNPDSRNSNFKFKNSPEIVDWIKNHLWVGWQLTQVGEIIEKNEKCMIIEKRPILNLVGSPDPDSCHYLLLKKLRAECLGLARTLYGK